MSATGLYYDRLSKWTAVARLVGYGGGREQLTVHRALADPRKGGRPTVTRLHDLLLERLPPLAAPRVLDAGCGLGGTILDLASRIAGEFTGVTLSEAQAAIGRRAAAQAGLSGRVAIHVGNYDSPPTGPFDLVLAIESLAHSPDPHASIRALVSRLAPGAHLVVVDDMPAPGASGGYLERFKSGWRLPVLWTAAQYGESFHSSGLVSVMDLDLTPEVRPRSNGRIRQLELANRAARRLTFSAAGRDMLDSYYGGLALERLYRLRQMTYRLMIGRWHGPQHGAIVDASHG